MSWRPGGAAALRQAAESGLGVAPVDHSAELHLSPPRIVPFSLTAAAVCALAGLGILPAPAAVLLDVGAAACYLVALRAALPRWPELPWPSLGFLSGMQPAILPLAGFVSASVALAEQPGLPGEVVLPLGVLLLLTLGPWLEVAEERRSSARWGPTLLALLTLAVPLPIFILAMSPSVAAPVRAATVAAVALVPTWRLISLSRRSWSQAWKRALVVTALLGVAAGLSVLLRVPTPLLPVALLLGWYGLTGVVSQPNGRSTGAFAVFVVLAAVMLAVGHPL
ncbi:MAG: hypothetical protein WCB86_04115 [Candidatus Dormiibacterota bacterium]